MNYARLIIYEKNGIDIDNNGPNGFSYAFSGLCVCVISKAHSQTIMIASKSNTLTAETRTGEPRII